MKHSLSRHNSAYRTFPALLGCEVKIQWLVTMACVITSTTPLPPRSRSRSPSPPPRRALEQRCSYEDFVGGAPADVVVFYRPADPSCVSGATPAAAGSSNRPGVSGEVAAAAESWAGSVSAEQEGDGGEGGGVLTVVVRPLPSTAPASEASDSSIREGRRWEGVGGGFDDDILKPYDMALV